MIPTFQSTSSGLVAAEVELTTEADVYLVDADNYRKMQSGMDYTYYGGHFDHTPVKVSVNSTFPTTWYLIVDDGGSGNSFQYRWLS